MSDNNERLLDALEGSTRITTEVIGEVRTLKTRFDSMDDSLGGKMADLEREMGTMNAHLDNLVRETQVTNQLLREDMEDRKRAEIERAQADAEERDWRRKMEERRLDRKEEVEDDKRATARKLASEAWSIFKQPLGYLVAGIIAWFLIQHLALPQGIKIVPVPSPDQLQEQVEEAP